RWRNFVDAAAGAAVLTTADAALAARIGEALHADQTTDVSLLTRLAWIQLKSQGEPGRASAGSAAALLDRAVALNPTDAAARRELAGVLGAAGRTREAVGLLEGVALGRDDRILLVSLHAGARDYDAALEQCAVLLRSKPDDRKVLRLKADVLSWAGRYKEALALLERLSKASPGASAPGEPEADELKLRMAEVTLWSGEHERALLLFQGLLEAKFDRPSIQAGFVAAAASVGNLTPAQKKLVAQIADNLVGQTGMSAPPVGEDAIFLSR